MPRFDRKFQNLVNHQLYILQVQCHGYQVYIIFPASRQHNPGLLFYNPAQNKRAPPASKKPLHARYILLLFDSHQSFKPKSNRTNSSHTTPPQPDSPQTLPHQIPSPPSLPSTDSRISPDSPSSPPSPFFANGLPLLALLFSS